MERRELLKLIAVLTGGAMIGGEAFLSGCKTAGKTEAGFTAANIALLNEVGETIIPTTDSPGAKAANVGEYMKAIVTDCYTQAEQDAFMKGLTQLDEASKKMHSKSFMDATPEQRHELLVSLEKEAKAYNEQQKEKDKPEKKKFDDEGKPYDFVDSPRHYYTMMKQMSIGGYFSSEIGAKQALRYLPVPGKYDGAYTYNKGDKAFSE
jgi:hypothetical protein